MVGKIIEWLIDPPGLPTGDLIGNRQAIAEVTTSTPATRQRYVTRPAGDARRDRETAQRILAGGDKLSTRHLRARSPAGRR